MTALPKHSFITDPQGQPVFVQIPAKDWAKFVKEFQHMQTLLTFKSRFQTAFREVRDIQNGKKDAITLGEFLHEL